MRTSKTGFKCQVSGVSKKAKTVLSVCLLLFTIHCSLFTVTTFAEDLKLQDLIDEALKNNHDLIIADLKVSTSKYKIPQVSSFPDPMFMFGYQNEGWNRYTYGEMQGAQWMFSASQMFPFPGKLSLKEEMASRDSESLKALADYVKIAIIVRIKELYYELFLSHKNVDLIKDKASLFSKIEDAAIARYSSGMGQQQEVLMAQTEKYMLLEKEEMLKQKQQSIEAMLNTSVGRDVNSPLERPVEPVYVPYKNSMDEILKMAYENSPQIKAKEKMIEASETKVKMAEKEYYPDFTFAANLFKRKREFEDMWSLTTTVNIPLFFRTKQKMAVLEAESALSEAKHELEAVKFMLSSNIRDNYSMLRASEKLMELYKSGLIPKTYQDFELAISGYITGKVEALTVITRLKSLIDYELLYWGQFVEREKAIARLEALTAVNLLSRHSRESGNPGKTKTLDSASSAE
ncbi:MAG: TolC family protein [Nitrospirae bacterium]|nr:TolC family protein [Nitrospirota bacterium]